MKPGTLRGQLTLVYTLALVGGLVIFAALALVVLDRSERTSLDQRLLSEGRTLSSVIDIQNGEPIVEANDRQQFTQVIGVKLSGAVYRADGRQLLSTTLPVPTQILHLVFSRPRTEDVQTVGASDALLRVALLPVRASGRIVAYAVLWRSLDPIEDLDWRSAIVFAFAIPVIVAFAIFFGTMVAGRGLRPLRRLADLASDIEAHDLSRRLAVPSEHDELGRLCATFDRMLDRLEAAFVRERRFTSDASHELRGPLSVIHAEAELALRRRRSYEEYERTLRTILEEADALEGLTAELLAAARAQSVPSRSQTIAFGTIVAAVCARLGVVAAARNVRIEAACQPDLRVYGDLAELTRLVFAIVHNAVKYTPADSVVMVSASREGCDLRLEVRDRGPGFSEDALKHAFERFWRDDEARSTEGNGLGLSIAQNIAESAGGSITLANLAHGAAVTVTLPFSDPDQRHTEMQQDG